MFKLTPLLLTILNQQPTNWNVLKQLRCYCWLIQQTSSNSFLWSLKYSWWGCFPPLVCCVRGQLPSTLFPISYATVSIFSSAQCG